ncbi:Signal recognition particle subunit SRP54 2-like protein [Drosera capensis]
MVLAQLGGSISRALQQMSNATIIDEAVLSSCLNEIVRALLQADVNFKLVSEMRNNIKKIVNLDDLAAGHNKRRIIQQAVFNELCKMLDAGKPSFTPKKGKTSVVMFVGLQGSGKTTTCTKYAYYHQKKGWKPALVCADTFRAGAFDQLKQNATKAKIPFYGSYMESDPVKIAVEGVERFKKENCDLIIIDTSGRHKQEAALFEEMRQVSEATKPDLAIFVMDSSIGQAAFDQAQAFKQSVAVGAVIITKMDGHAKGGGALSAVAATKSPVIFIGTGEHMDEFEVFDVKPFVSRLLGMGDWSGFMDKIHEVVPMDQQPELLQKLTEGTFTLRIMYDQFQNILKMGPIGQNAFILEQDCRVYLAGSKLGCGDGVTYIILPELDSTNPKLMNDSRIMRIARGSGRPVREIQEMLEEYKRLAKIWSKMKGLKLPKKGEMSALSRNLNAQHMSKVLPPQMLKQMGGMGGLQNLMKQMGGMGGKDMMGMFGGGDKDRDRVMSQKDQTSSFETYFEWPKAQTQQMRTSMAVSNITSSPSRLTLLRRPPPMSPCAAGATILLPSPRHVSYHRRVRASAPKTEADVVDYAASTSSVPRPPDFQWNWKRRMRNRCGVHVSRLGRFMRECKDDSIYIGKLAVGSIVGAGVIKYGSIVFPSITSPNLFQALLMVSIPMVVAVLLLLKGSRKD